MPTTRNGCAPAARSAAIASRSARASSRCSGSVEIQRSWSRPIPNRSAALCAHVWVSAEQYAVSRPVAGPLGGDVPGRLRAPGGDEADEVGHVPAADEQSARVGRIPDQLGEPGNGLTLDLGGHRAERPAADVRVHRCREQVGECADRRLRAADVAPEARVPDVGRVPEHQVARLADELGRGRSLLGEAAAAERRLDVGRGLAGGDRQLARALERLEERRQVVDELVADPAELVGAQSERRVPTGCHRRTLAFGAWST